MMVPTHWLPARWFTSSRLRPFDGPYRDPDGNDVMDFIVARIPTRTAAEAAAYRAKLESASSLGDEGSAARLVQAIGDDDGSGEDAYLYFGNAAEALAEEVLPDGWHALTLRRSNFPASEDGDAQANAALYGAIGSGAQWFHGYGQTGSMDVAFFLDYGLDDTSALDSIPEAGREMIAFLSMCQSGEFGWEFSDGGATYLADAPGEEILLDAPNGWRFCAGFSGHVTSYTAHLLADGLAHALSEGNATTAGAVAEAARRSLSEGYRYATESDPMERGLNLLGDPAIPVRPAPDPAAAWREGFELADGFVWRRRRDPEGPAGGSLPAGLALVLRGRHPEPLGPPVREGDRALCIRTETIEPFRVLETFHLCDVKRSFAQGSPILLTWDLTARTLQGSLWIAPEIVLDDGTRVLESRALNDVSGETWPRFSVPPVAGWSPRAVMVPAAVHGGRAVDHLALTIEAQAAGPSEIDSTDVVLDGIRVRPIPASQDATVLNGTFEGISVFDPLPLDWWSPSGDLVGVADGVDENGGRGLLIDDSALVAPSARAFVVRGPHGGTFERVELRAKGTPGRSMTISCRSADTDEPLWLFTHVFSGDGWEDIAGEGILTDDAPVVVLELQAEPGSAVFVGRVEAQPRVVTHATAGAGGLQGRLDVLPSAAADRFSIRWRLEERGRRAELRIHDVRGRLLRRWSQPADRAAIDVTWPDDGLPVAPGVYFVSATSGGRSISRKLTVVR
jgi:hypothetical protein